MKGVNFYVQYIKLLCALQKKKNQQNLMKQSKTDKILSELETFQVFSVFGHSRSNFSI